MSDSITPDQGQHMNDLDDCMENFADMWVAFEGDGWIPKGLWNDDVMAEDFEIVTTDMHHIHVTNGIPNSDDELGNHITDVASVGMCIQGTMTRLTWGEALELAQALTAATRVGYYG